MNHGTFASLLAPVLSWSGSGANLAVPAPVGNPLCKIEPDTCVLTAVKGATRHGAMGVYGAATGITRHVITVAVRALFNQIGLAQIPMHDAFMNVLFGGGQRASRPPCRGGCDSRSQFQPPAGRCTYRTPAPATSRCCRLTQSIHQPLPHPFRCVQFRNGDESFLQQLDQRVEKRHCLQRAARIGIEPAVGIEQTLGNVAAQVVRKARVSADLLVASFFTSRTKLDFVQLRSIAERFREALQQCAWDFNQISLLLDVEKWMCSHKCRRTRLSPPKTRARFAIPSVLRPRSPVDQQMRGQCTDRVEAQQRRGGTGNG